MSPGHKHKYHLNTITKHFTTKPFVPRQINEKYVTSILNNLSYKCQDNKTSPRVFFST